MNIVSLKRVQDVTAVIESSLYLLDKTEKFSCSSLFQEQFRFEYLLNIAMINEVAPAERKSAYIAFERWEEILQPAQDLIVTIFYLFMRVFGLSAGAFVLSALKKIKLRITQ